MNTSLRLLLPAMLPSRRFFDAVTASPRLDYAVLSAPDAIAGPSQEFRPRPATLGIGTMLRRLLWNAPWNENLFVVSLAERLVNAANPESAAHSQRELLIRVARHLDRCGDASHGFLQIRLRFVSRDGAAGGITSHIHYQSVPYPLADLTRP